MLGILLLAIFYIWLLIGDSRGLSFKILLSFLMIASYVVFLKNQGANNNEILEIIFSLGR